MRSRRTIIVFFIVSVAFTLGAFRSSVESSQAVLTEADLSARHGGDGLRDGDAELHIDAKYWETSEPIPMR